MDTDTYVSKCKDTSIKVDTQEDINTNISIFLNCGYETSIIVPYSKGAIASLSFIRTKI